MSLLEQLPLFRPQSSSPVVRARYLQVGARIVAYELRQAAGRRLTMSIDERGLRVGAPKRLSLAEIEAFVREHGDWVLAKLDEFAARHGARQIAIRDGTRLPVLGREVEVRVTSGANRVHWREDALVLAARPEANLDALARKALQWRAFEHFVPRRDYFAERMGRPAPPLRLSSARTRWGSCSARTGIRLNWRLVHLPPSFADYVIAHEMAHLVEMNHGPRFWAVVADLFPEWREVRAELKVRAAEIPLV